MREDSDLIVADAAVTFTSAYYNALEKSRDNLSLFYPSKSANEEAPPVTKPHIAWNGNSYDDGEALIKAIKAMPATFYTVHAVDAHVVNPRYHPDLSQPNNVSFAVLVSGWLRTHNRQSGPVHEFSETFVLVPNRARLMNKGAQQSKKEFLVGSQNFRFTVSHDAEEASGFAGMDVDD